MAIVFAVLSLTGGFFFIFGMNLKVKPDGLLSRVPKGILGTDITLVYEKEKRAK